MQNLETILREVLDGSDLRPEQAEALMGHVMDGELGAVRLAAALAALRIKGVTPQELAGFARAMRGRMVPVVAACADRAVDTCGTGGDGQGTFNISTVAALVTAAAGVPVAKHGNRAASSRCGSADVLEALGVRLDLGPEAQARMLDEVGLAFLFAPAHHPAMRHAMPVRRELGVRTAFNLLGPLTNPAGVRRQLLGVYDPRLVGLVAAALRDLGAERALVVHGRDGQDELSLTSETMATELRDGRLHQRAITPESVGLRRCRAADLSGGDAATSARLVVTILDGAEGPRTDAVLLNAAGALVVADAVDDLAAGLATAREAIASGAASRLLAELRQASHDLAGMAGDAAGGAA